MNEEKMNTLGKCFIHGDRVAEAVMQIDDEVVFMTVLASVIELWCEHHEFDPVSVTLEIVSGINSHRNSEDDVNISR